MERITNIRSHSSCFNMFQLQSLAAAPRVGFLAEHTCNYCSPLPVPSRFRCPKVFNHEYLEAQVKELKLSGNDFEKAKRMYVLGSLLKKGPQTVFQHLLLKVRDIPLFQRTK